MKVFLRSPARFNKFRDFYGFGKVFYALTEALSNRREIEMLDAPENADVQICLCLPDVKWDFFPWWGRRRHRRQAIYTVWETTRIPYGWAEAMNTGAAALTASTWCRKIFKDCGVTVPIHVVPHGVNPDRFPYLERKWDGDRFYFLWQGMHPYDRKGLRYVRKAFAELDLKDAWLIEKLYPMVSMEWGPAVYKSERRIEIGQFLEREQYLEMLSQCHVSVNPFRGEGFGLMPLETACTGMMTIATNFSGPADYLHKRWFRKIDRFVPRFLKKNKIYDHFDKKYFWPLKYKLCEPQQDYISTSLHVNFITEPAQDAEPDIEDLKSAMRWAYNNREAAKQRGKLARKYVAENWTWEKAADKFVEACKVILES